MAEPIDYRIWRNLQTALQAIQEADGYFFSVAAVAVKLDPNHDAEALIAPDGPRPFILLQLGEEKWTYWPASQVDVVMPFTIHFVTESNPTIDEDRMRVFFRACSDIERAIAESTGRGGLATDTKITRRLQLEEAVGAQVWAMVHGEVKRSHTYGQANGA